MRAQAKSGQAGNRRPHSPGRMTLRAGSLTLEDKGKLQGKGGTSGPGGAVVIETVNDILIDSRPIGGAVNLKGAKPEKIDGKGL